MGVSTLNIHMSFKKCLNQTVLVFFDICEKRRCQKSLQLFNLDNFCISYGHLKVITYFKIRLEY